MNESEVSVEQDSIRVMLVDDQTLVRQGVPVVGLEPSCLLTLRDEFGADLRVAKVFILKWSPIADQALRNFLNERIAYRPAHAVVLHCFIKFRFCLIVERDNQIIPPQLALPI